MIRKLALALMPLAMLTASVSADDDLQIDVTNITDADVDIVTGDLDIDVDALTEQAGEDTEDAIEACFRRFGYGYRGWGYRYFGGCYNYYRPLCTYRPIRYAPPICRVVLAPVYTYYWGCY